MTQEEKVLLLKDLAGRLSYGVMCHYNCVAEYDTVVIQKANCVNKLEGIIPFNGQIGYMVGGDKVNALSGDIKPYLRPLSSMTEEEKEELSHLLPKDWSVEIDKLNNFYFDMSPSIFMEIDVFLNIIDWLNAHHFDYRGLIEKGLAIAVTKENNPYETE